MNLLYSGAGMVPDYNSQKRQGRKEGSEWEDFDMEATNEQPCVQVLFFFFYLFLFSLQTSSPQV